MPEAKQEVYKTIGDVKLTIYRFEPAGHKPTDRRAAIVFFFGGGWRAGTPGQFHQQCKYLASRGMVAMTADYRVSSRHKTKAIDCVADAKSAVRWIRANAERLGIDPKRIAAGGGSAGGHIAACTGIIKGLEEKGEDAAVSSVPDAMVLFNPALVLAEIDGESPFPPGRGADIAARMGVEPEALSPYHHVNPGAPPTLVLHGKGDTTVTYKTAQQFTGAMKAAGNTCELAGYEGQPHGFFNYGRGDGSHYRQTVARMDEFLAALGFLQPAVKDDAASARLPDKSKFHLYLLIGQSNMAGRGKVLPEDKQPDDRILMLDKQNRWVPAVDPVHFDKSIAGVGMARGFAREMIQGNEEVTIGLIPCAVGGTPLSRWQKGGDLYKQAVARAKVALRDGTLRGVLWHQGENDSQRKDDAASYAQRLDGMIGDLRAELGAEEVPVVVGTLGDFCFVHPKLPHAKTVNDALVALPKRVAQTAVADAKGLKHKGDKIHFGRDEILELGRRYAKAMRGIQGK